MCPAQRGRCCACFADKWRDQVSARVRWQPSSEVQRARPASFQFFWGTRVRSPTRESAGVLLALSLLWGSSWIGNEIVRHQARPLHFALLENLLACACLASAVAARKAVARLRNQAVSPMQVETVAPASASPGLRAWPNILLGLTLFALPDLLVTWASGHGAGAWIPEVYACMPLGLALAAGELSAAAILGPCAMLVLLNGSLPLAPATLVWILPIGAAVALQGWSLCFVRRNPAAVLSLSSVLIQLGTASAALWVALTLVTEPASTPLRSWPASATAALCLLAALATALAYPLFYRLLRTLSPTQAAVCEWWQPLIAIGESGLLLHVRPGLPMILSALILILCSGLILGHSETEAPTLFCP